MSTKNHSILTLLSSIAAFLFVTPNPVQAGELRWTSAGPHGAVVRRVALDPTTPSTLYMGTERQGVFKSTDRGLSWTATSSGLGSRDIFDLVVDPWAPQTVYAATASGVAKSVDGGRHWRAASDGLPSVAALHVLIDPRDPTVLYAGLAADAGVFKTLDGGETWSAVNEGLRLIGFFGRIDVNLLKMDPVHPSTLYAQIGSPFVSPFFTRPTHFHKTTDGGTTWREIPGPHSMVDVLAIDHQNTNHLYAVNDLGIFTSTDGGESWREVNDARRGIITLVADPDHAGVLYAGTSQGEILKSVNGGESWRKLHSHRFRSSPIRDLVFDTTQSDRLYAGTTAGFFRSPDRGHHWREGSVGLNAMPASEVLVDPADSNVVYAGTRGGGLFKSTDRGQSWTAHSTGLHGAVVEDLAIDAGHPGRIFAAAGHPGRVLTSSGRFHFSTDGGRRWRQRVVRTEKLRPLTIAFDPHDPKILYTGSVWRGIHKSTDGGRNWLGVRAPTNFAAQGGRPSGAMVVDEEGTIYLGYFKGVLIGTDQGQSWRWSPRFLAERKVLDLALDPSDHDVLYALAHGGLHKTTDAGATWVLINESLADQRARKIVIDPSNPERLYAATLAGGVQVSVDGGVSWAPLNAGLPTRWVNTVSVDPKDASRLYASTDRGVFDLDL